VVLFTGFKLGIDESLCDFRRFVQISKDFGSEGGRCFVLIWLVEFIRTVFLGNS
jgi:hypothetical protein